MSEHVQPAFDSARLGRVLVHESEGLEAAKRTRSQEGSGVIQARRKLRQRAEPELRSRVIWMREQMRNAYGAKEANRLLGHRGRTPRALRDLKIMAENMVSLLPIAEPPKPKPGSPVVPADWAEYLRPALADFSRHLKKLRKPGGRARFLPRSARWHLRREARLRRRSGAAAGGKGGAHDLRLVSVYAANRARVREGGQVRRIRRQLREKGSSTLLSFEPQSSQAGVAAFRQGLESLDAEPGTQLAVDLVDEGPKPRVAARPVLSDQVQAPVPILLRRCRRCPLCGCR